MKESQFQGGPNSKDIFERPNLTIYFGRKLSFL